MTRSLARRLRGRRLGPTSSLSLPRRLGYAPMGRKIVWASMALAPLAIVLHYAVGIGHNADFGLSAAGLIPLAWLIGEATEHAAEHTGPGIGGFLNASFGN